MSGRVQVQPDNVCGLLFKVRIVRGHVVPGTVGHEAVPAPGARGPHMTDAKVRTEPSRASVRPVLLATSTPVPYVPRSSGEWTCP